MVTRRPRNSSRQRNAPAMVYSLDGHSAYQLLTYLPAAWRRRVTPIYYGPDGKVLSTQMHARSLLNLLPASDHNHGATPARAI